MCSDWSGMKLKKFAISVTLKFSCRPRWTGTSNEHPALLSWRKSHVPSSFLPGLLLGAATMQAVFYSYCQTLMMCAGSGGHDDFSCDQNLWNSGCAMVLEVCRRISQNCASFGEFDDKWTLLSHLSISSHV